MRRRIIPSVEALEDRRLLSVNFAPTVLPLNTINHARGFLTVVLLSDDANARTLLGSTGPLSVSVTEGSTTRNVTAGFRPAHHVDLNNDRISDLAATLRRGILKGLPTGTVTLTLQGSGVAESGTFTIAAPSPRMHAKK